MHKPKRKLKYFDLIVLCSTQILLLTVFVKEIDFIYNLDTIAHSLRLALPMDDYDNPIDKPFSAKAFLEESKKEHKKFTTVYLTGDLDEDEKHFELIKYESRKIEYTCDTMDIIKVHFVSENTYGQFVNLVNMMVEDHHKRYMLYKDDFYIIGSPCSETSFSMPY